jgi:DNA (cytosine-5)-methyltransferase 1
MIGRKLKVLDLFSGIGGFSLGLERTGGFETVAFCEIEEYPRRVLAKHWPGTPIHLDVRKLTGADIGPVDVICGGYPCQPFSTAGKRQGADDDRHLWPEFMRLVAELRPAWVIGENVAGHISMGLDDVLADLEAENYACRPFVIPACAVGASHRRDRF